MLSKKSAPYVFISPFFIMFIVLMIVPMFYGFWISLHKVQYIGNMSFVGFKNYLKLFTDPTFFQSLKVTGIFTVLHGSTHFIMALAAALILNSKIKGRTFFRTTFFLPVTTSLVVAALIWMMILDGDIGLLNVLLSKLGFNGNYRWLESTRLALPSIVLVANWRWFGYQMIILLAGLQNIPEVLYEAAKIDGANAYQRLRYITLPQLYPVMFYCIVVIVIGALKLFSEPFVLTQGGPADSTMSMALYLYTNAFRYFKIGFASALGYVLALIIMVITFIQVKVLGRGAGL